jgi:hypothetical protein
MVRELHFSFIVFFFVLGKAVNIKIFKDFTRANKWKRATQ